MKLIFNRHMAGIAFAGALAGLSSCSDFLSTLPDNRTAELKNADQVQYLLNRAYPTTGSYKVLAELSSDNVAEATVENQSRNRYYEQFFNWEKVTETGYDSPLNIWESSYASALAANTALASIARLENESGQDLARLRSSKGEALVLRGFAHFILTTTFAQHYSPEHATTDLGVPYITTLPNTLLYAQRKGTVQENYDSIQQDLEQGLELLVDDYYAQPKYHFTQSSAHAFATRFFLYKGDWGKVVEHATKVLGSTPEVMMRNYDAITSLPETWDIRVRTYISSTSPANLLLMAPYSALGQMAGGYRHALPFAHTHYTSDTETLRAPSAWEITDPFEGTINVPKLRASNLSRMYKTIIPRSSFQYELITATTGYPRTTFAEFTSEEVLLSRAEAYIHQGNLSAALADMNLWIRSFSENYSPLTEAMIRSWNRDTEYHTIESPTARKRFTAPLATRLSALQQDYLQVLLHMRRIETILCGLRFYDVKRYGIEVERIAIENGVVRDLGNVLRYRDPRAALELPEAILDAGIESNRRDKLPTTTIVSPQNN